ncbi:hypothetical protein H0H81_002437, partial [Sphagnurus paluster]
MIADSLSSFSLATCDDEQERLPIVLRTSTPPLRTLDDVRLQVAHEVAVRAITQSQVVEGVRIGVSLTLSKSDDVFLQKVADVIAHQLTLSEFLFLIGAPSTAPGSSSPLVIVGSSPSFVQRAALLISSKFIGRLKSATASEYRWSTYIDGLVASSASDDAALWDSARKATRTPIDPLLPPPGSRSIAQILADARAKLQRVTPEQAYAELREPEVGPTFLVDIRPEAQRARGGIYGSLIVERNVLEWRFDPRSDARLPVADRYDLRVIVFCEEGYTS